MVRHENGLNWAGRRRIVWWYRWRDRSIHPTSPIPSIRYREQAMKTGGRAHRIMAMKQDENGYRDGRHENHRLFGFAFLRIS